MTFSSLTLFEASSFPISSYDNIPHQTINSGDVLLLTNHLSQWTDKTGVFENEANAPVKHSPLG